MIAGSGSGCGKTTVTAALLKALSMQGEHLAPYKCGPDYIDPMFHQKITGTASINLDSVFLDEAKLLSIFAWHQQERSMAVLEGVMGFYDGQADTTKGSAYEVAKLTKTPVILTVRPSGVGLSLAALVKGYQHFREDAGIKGVILNGVRPMMYEYYKNIIEKETGLPVCGFLPADDHVALESRHLGLVTADEVGQLDEIICRLGELACQYIDLDKIRAIAATAPEILAEEAYQTCIKRDDWHQNDAKPLKIAVAKDQAFNFYYEDNLLTLKEKGMEVLYFSPLSEKKLPEGISGLYIGGGYPELYAKTLSDNKSLRDEIKEKISEGMPLIAECGGYMYLSETFVDRDGCSYPMCGLVSGQCHMTDRLGSFGYMTVNGGPGTLIGEDMAYAHEFHYSAMDDESKDLMITKGRRSHRGGVSTETIYAGYPHLYFYNRPEMMLRLKEAMTVYQHKTYGEETYE